MNKIYLLVYDPNKTNAATLHGVITSSPFVLNWWHYISPTYLIKSEYTLESLQNEIIRKMPNHLFFMIEVNANNFGGWLPREAWDWIREQR